MLSKEVRDILEGTHFFLVDGLKNETLSGKVDCMRKGLKLQLEGLKTPYPYLNFTSNNDVNANLRVTSTSLPYLNVDQQNGNHSRMSTSSSGSTNYSSTGGSNGSSTGYSGDGIVSSQLQCPVQCDVQIENYEEFEEIEGTQAYLKRQSQNSKCEFDPNENVEERDEDAYAEEVDPVSFRILVGKCNYHGELLKKSKTLLPGVRNLKSFKCILVSNLLYFFLKESDDKQKKVIDLNGYDVEEAQIDENKLNSRRRDFGIELVAPGKKTHVFFTHKKASRDRWITNIARAISCSQSLNHARTAHESHSDKLSGNFSQDEDDDDSDGDCYEELNLDEVEEENPTDASTNALWRPPSPQIAATDERKNNQTGAYYTVPSEDESEKCFPHTYYNQQKIRAPKRPPLPENHRASQHQKRPLPEAPNTMYEYPENAIEDEIYCEIDEDSELQRSNNKAKCNDNLSKSLDDILSGTDSLSKQIFEAIIGRVPTRFQKSSNKTWDKMSFRSNASSNESYDSPSEVASSKSNLSWKLVNDSNAPPPLPPKGMSITRSSDTESEYNVPSSISIVEEFYHVPSPNPKPIELQMDNIDFSKRNNVNHDTKDNEKESFSVYIKGNTKNENDQTSTLCKDQTNNSESQVSVVLINKSSSNLAIKSNEVKDSQLSTNLPNSSSYVKDLVAKLNQTDETTENNSHPFNNVSNFRKSTSCINQQRNPKILSKSQTVEDFKIIKVAKNSNENIKIPEQNNWIMEGGNNEHMSKENNRSMSLFIEENVDNTHQINDDKLKENGSSLYIAKFAFVSSTPKELSFNRGDEILVKDYLTEDSGRFWKGMIKGRIGLVPKEYLRKKE